LQQLALLFNHLVDAAKQRDRDGDADESAVRIRRTGAKISNDGQDLLRARPAV